MKKPLMLLIPLLLAGAPAAAQEPVTPAESGSITRQAANRESPLLDFEYSWPQEVTPETQLVERLKDDLAKSYDEALKNARENKTDTEKYGGPFNQNMFNRSWTLEGRTERLISLVSNTDTFAGGAHPNHNSSALLWDRTANAEVKLAGLFAAADGLEGAIRTEYCKLLDAERLKRRQGEELDGEFGECPAFSELTIAPADKDGKGGFDSILLIADPYVAGPYAEGEYQVDIAVSAALIDALKPEFRSSFEAQRAQ